MTPYYQDDHVTLYHGDALDFLPTVQGAGAVILDPPYSMSPNSVRGADDGAAGAIAAPVMLVDRVLGHVSRIVDVGGIAPFICDWRRMPDMAYLATRNGLRITTCVAWTRTNAGTGGMFRGAWDPIMVLSKGAPTLVDKSAVPNVLALNYPHSRVHPYEKPVGLWGHFLRRIPPTTVVDPFMGAGSALVDARANGHRYIGCDVEERYCEIAARRCAQEVLAL